MLTGWRLASPEYASTADEMMSGEGAFLYGGRWNSRGVRVVYLGSSLAQAAMELLIHLGRSDILKTLYKMELSFSDDLVQYIALVDLSEDWRKPSMVSSVQSVGDTWATNKSSLIIQVPSASVPGEYNYLFNPLHPDASKATLSAVTEFSYDHRLLKK